MTPPNGSSLSHSSASWPVHGGSSSMDKIKVMDKFELVAMIVATLGIGGGLFALYVLSTQV